MSIVNRNVQGLDVSEIVSYLETVQHEAKTNGLSQNVRVNGHSVTFDKHGKRSYLDLGEMDIDRIAAKIAVPA
jgi:hypothetical protein